MNQDPFKEYIRESELAKRDKGYAWRTAIGLQAVDGLKPSAYLVRTAIRNIEGEISFAEANALLQTYYASRPARDASDRTEEADKVSARIAALLSERAFSFTPNAYLATHRKLFVGIYAHAGRIRDYNITKKEWVLNGATVLYGSATELRATLDYDFSEEKKFSYQNLSMDAIIRHLAVFVSRLWQIHVFGEGNTRTTAVFFIQYLRTLGFNVTNDIFAEHAWYFRNALVRANYNDLKNGIHETTAFLEVFLRNLLLHEQHPLRNRTLHISGTCTDTETSDIGVPTTGGPSTQTTTQTTTQGATQGDLTERDKRLVEFLLQHPNDTQVKIAAALGWDVNTVKYYMHKLKKNAVIRRHGTSQHGYWEVLYRG